MPATYSINIATTIEAYRKPDITSVLVDLPDNTQKLISPKDVRDAFLSTWANSAFKQTIGTASIEYIGIDSGNPDNRDIKEKIFIGKRNYTGTDIMNTSLLSSDSDIYLYNTKGDTQSQIETKISILAGTNSSVYINAPYISSKTNDTDNGFNLDFINPSTNGPINIYSQTGRVSVNGIIFPTVSETSTSALNGRLLKYSGTYPNGSLRWADESVTIANIGTPGAETNIYGSPSNVNGQSLEFVDDSLVPQTIGGIITGSSFSAFSFNGINGYQNWPLTEVLRKLLYPHVPPTISLNVTNPSTGTDYFEVGSTSSALFDYSLTEYSYDISTYSISGTTYSGSYSGSAGVTFSATFSSSVYTTYPTSSMTFTMSVVTATNSGATTSTTDSIKFVSPIFYSFDPTYVDVLGGSHYLAHTTGILMNSSSKYIGSSHSVSLVCSGSGYLYFISPASYSNLSIIKDPNLFIIHDSSNLPTSSFTYSNSVTPTGISVNYGDYILYRTIATCSYTTNNGTFSFIF